MVAKELLENVGIMMELAENGQEAIDRVTKESFDMVLMDIQMPVMDGLTACRHIRAHPNGQEIPIIAMTAHAMTGDREKSLEAGMNDHITKPVNSQKLYETLTRWISPQDKPEISTILTPLATNAADAGPRVPATVPGIDVMALLRRFNGKHSSALRILLTSQEDFSSASKEMRTLLSGKREDDLEAALRLAHTIKGLAGTLEAGRLQKAAFALETGIHQKDHAAWPGLLDTFDAALEQIVTSIQELKAEEEARNLNTIRTESGKTKDNSQVIHLLKELAGYVRTNDFKARSTLDILLPLMQDTTLQADMNQLQKHLGRFDFKGSIPILTRIFQAMNIS
ncbi:MAG: response regulator, partial [Magnetococcales bacterium]|nr:response regulator [Magnetococcales bacterium]